MAFRDVYLSLPNDFFTYISAEIYLAFYAVFAIFKKKVNFEEKGTLQKK